MGTRHEKILPSLLTVILHYNEYNCSRFDLSHTRKDFSLRTSESLSWYMDKLDRSYSFVATGVHHGLDEFAIKHYQDIAFGKHLHLTEEENEITTWGN